MIALLLASIVNQSCPAMNIQPTIIQKIPIFDPKSNFSYLSVEWVDLISRTLIINIFTSAENCICHNQSVCVFNCQILGTNYETYKTRFPVFKN